MYIVYILIILCIFEYFSIISTSPDRPTQGSPVNKVRLNKKH